MVFYAFSVKQAANDEKGGWWRLTLNVQVCSTADSRVFPLYCSILITPYRLPLFLRASHLCRRTDWASTLESFRTPDFPYLWANQSVHVTNLRFAFTTCLFKFYSLKVYLISCSYYVTFQSRRITISIGNRNMISWGKTLQNVSTEARELLQTPKKYNNWSQSDHIVVPDSYD